MSLPEPITRKEQYYDGIAKGNASKLPEPITREEQYLEYIAKNGGGGGGGTTDYEALDNKPSVNSVELSGNKTLDDLGIQGKLTFDNEPTEGSQNPVKSGGVYEALESLNEAISEKPDEYADLPDKPSINSVELSGNKTASELGLQAELDGAQTVSGNPITVADAEAMNAESVVVELEPKQDLHGYDEPWVGGAGKNKLKVDATSKYIDGVTYTVYEDGTILVNGTSIAYGFAWIHITSVATFNSLGLVAGERYILSGNPDGENGLLYIENYDNQHLYEDTGSGVSFTYNGETNIRVGFIVLMGHTISNKVIKPMIRLATETDPTFTPYSNICPISGYSEVNVERVGKNLLNINASGIVQNAMFDTRTLETVGSENYDISDYIEVKEGVTYKYSRVADSLSVPAGVFYDKNKNPISFKGNIFEMTIPSGIKYVRLELLKIATNQQFEVGSSKTTYEPYQGATYTIDLDGTKYGGTLDVTEGGYSDEWGYISGSSVSDLTSLGATTGVTNSGNLYIRFADITAYNPDDTPPTRELIQCNELENQSTNILYWSNASGITCGTDNGMYFTVKDITTQADMDTWLSNNPIQIAYRKKTPSSISTTPTDIPLLENTNNISTDGTNIQLKYQPNNVIGEAKAYTDEKCAEVLPPLPTTDGTYHLSCEVSSGVGVLSWVSDS